MTLGHVCSVGDSSETKQLLFDIRATQNCPVTLRYSV